MSMKNSIMIRAMSMKKITIETMSIVKFFSVFIITDDQNKNE